MDLPPHASSFSAPPNPYGPFPWVPDDLYGLSAPMLPSELEDRSIIRDGQDWLWLTDLMEKTRQAFQPDHVPKEFVVAPMDVLVSRHPSKGLTFFPIELNGTGIGGLTNVPIPVIQKILTSLEELARVPLQSPQHLQPQGRVPLVLVGVSGQESDANPRQNRLIFEKFLYADAFRQGFQQDWGACQILPLLPQGQGNEHYGDEFNPNVPTVTVGYIKSFFSLLSVNTLGQLCFKGYPVTCVVNDRFIQNIQDRFVDMPFDTSPLVLANGCYGLGSDKGVFYGALQEWLAERKKTGAPSRLIECPWFAQAYTIESLLETLEGRWALGRSSVMKPQGTGLGHGIEFFTDPHESPDHWLSRVYRAADLIHRYYDIPSQGFPYVVSDFVDCDVLHQPGHPFDGHKYELRILLVREGDSLKICPSTVKLSSFKYDPHQVDRLMLINNVTAASGKHQSSGSGFLLPLANPKTLALLNIPVDVFESLCVELAQLGQYLLASSQRHPNHYRTQFPSLIEI